MKHIKKFLYILLALALVLNLGFTVLADDTNTFSITIENANAGHTYEAYQIFTGTPYIHDNSKSLVDLRWGANTAKSGEELTNALTDITRETLISYVDFKSEPVASVNSCEDGKYVITGLVPGYYLVKDKDDTLNGKDDACTAFILEVVENSTVSPKSAKPTVDKQVWDEIADAETNHTNGWGETADHAINERFQFKLIATLPEDENFAYYNTYKLVFTDVMSAGITFESIESVTVNETTVSGYTCTATAGQAGGSWALTINDITLGNTIDLTNGATVTVIYNAHLNENAKVENDKENKNTVYLEYSNNPNVSGTGDLGKTTEDHVWVFTYKVENTKTNEKNAPLAGAGFKLYADEACTTEIALIFDEHLSAYRPVKGEETAEEMFSAEETGKFNIVGLDAGTYYLKETTVPEGYNTCPNVEIVISATHVESLDGASAATTIDTEISKTNNTIVNKSGIQLPETGGAGTTALYIVGAILVATAGILLITKKRMTAE